MIIIINKNKEGHDLHFRSSRGFNQNKVTSSLTSLLNTPENTITYYNALCLSPQILHKHCFHCFWSGRNFNLVPDPRFFLLEKLWGRVCYNFSGQKFAFTTEYTLFSNAPLLHPISQNPLPTSLKERRKTTYFVKKR